MGAAAPSELAKWKHVFDDFGGELVGGLAAPTPPGGKRGSTASSTDGSVSPKRIGPRTAAAAAEQETGGKKGVLATAAEQDAAKSGKKADVLDAAKRVTANL